MKNIVEFYNKYKEIINYLIFGVLTTIISLIVYYFLTFSLLDSSNEIELQIANLISWIISVIFAYITNRKYVFSSKNDNIIKEITDFFKGRILTLLMDMLIMFVGVSLLHQNDKILKIISQIIVIVSNYLISKIFVFKNNK